MLATAASTPPILTRVKPPVIDRMVYSDWDDSMHDKDEVGLHESRDTLVEYSPRTITGFCTGRGPTTARELAADMPGFPMKFFATNNGQNLFWNREGKPADEFVRSLSLDNEDQGWAQHIRQNAGTWSVSNIRAIMHDIIAKEGFQPAPHLPPPFQSHEVFTRDIDTPNGKRNFTFCLPVDQPAFHARVTDGAFTDAHVTYNDELARRFGERMTEAGMKWQFDRYPPVNGKIVNFYQPPGITKKSLLEYMLQQFPAVHSVITIGDNVNDDHLDAENYGNVPNYPILAGTTHPNFEELSHHARMILRPPGAVGPGIRQHMEEIEHGVLVSRP